MMMNGASGKKRVGPLRQVIGYYSKYDSMEQQAQSDRCPGVPNSALVIFGSVHFLICTFVSPV